MVRTVEMAQWVKSIGSSSRGPGFNSQHPHGSSQLSVTSVPGDVLVQNNAHKIKLNNIWRK